MIRKQKKSQLAVKHSVWRDKLKKCFNVGKIYFNLMNANIVNTCIQAALSPQKMLLGTGDCAASLSKNIWKKATSNIH